MLSHSSLQSSPLLAQCSPHHFPVPNIYLPLLLPTTLLFNIQIIKLAPLLFNSIYIHKEAAEKDAYHNSVVIARNYNYQFKTYHEEKSNI